MKVLSRILTLIGGLAVSGVVAAFTAGIAAYYFLAPSLPSPATMRDVKLQIPLKVYSRDGRLIAQIGEKRRTPVTFESIPEVVVNAFLAAEDDRFFEHPGFDYQGITRAGVNLLLTGSRSQGGSTITQQLAREYFLTRDRTFIRKARELILAIQIENAFSKQEILELYLNKIFLGQRAYGVAAAAEVYFGKSLPELTVAEAATIAGLPKAPSNLNPVSNKANAIDRRAYVLRRMHQLSFITDDEYAAALAFPMLSRLHGPRVDLNAPYVAELVRMEMVGKYGLSAYTDGYKVVTTIDSRLQPAAENAVWQALLAYDRRHGYRGPLDRTELNNFTVGENSTDQTLVLSTGSGPEEESLRVSGELMQAFLDDQPSYPGMSVALVLSLTDDNNALVFIADDGLASMSWEQLKWRRYVNENIVGGEPETAGDVVAAGDVIRVRRTGQGWLLTQAPEAQGALVAIDPADGATVAMAGGIDFYSSNFNRATQSRRQPGSSFKPFIYSAALENGFTAASIVNDAPVVFEDSTLEDDWRPKNSTGKFYGPTRLREALVRSMNLVSVRLLRATGIRNTLRHLEPFGLPKSALPRNLSLALGSGGASPWEMAESYATFANGGQHIERYLIDQVLDTENQVVFSANPKLVCRGCDAPWFDDRDIPEEDPPRLASLDGAAATAIRTGTDAVPEPEDKPLIDAEVPEYADTDEMMEHGTTWRPTTDEAPQFFSNRNQPERVITEQNAYLIYDMMRDVITRGTGRRARDLNRPDLAGKTGTSNERRDAWFSGFNTNLVAVSWVGFDAERSLGAGEEGGRTALPMWKFFMRDALDNAPMGTMSEPDGIVTVRIMPDSGLVASANAGGSIFEIFREGHVPKRDPAAVDIDYPDDPSETTAEEELF